MVRTPGSGARWQPVRATSNRNIGLLLFNLHWIHYDWAVGGMHEQITRNRKSAQPNPIYPKKGAREKWRRRQMPRDGFKTIKTGNWL
jgi:hypothetical protein